ncbi:hypothetical protein KAX97_13090 [candidate division WOR-3 bacterium]|nr:hypothetical protein [candidate division WOR-3 bacterium]
MQNIIAMIFMITQMSGLSTPGMKKSLIRITPKKKADETLISRKTTIGGFGGPVVKLSEMNDEFAVLVGGCGGLIINHAFIFGGGGYGLVNDIAVGGAPYPEYRFLNLGYGGLLLGYVNRSRRLVHLSIHSLIGGGGLCYRTGFYDNWYSDAIFVIEPGIDLMMNITRHFRIGFGGSYRFINGVDLDGLSNDDVSGPSACLTFKFGKF